MQIIKTHKELAEKIRGSRVLHLNSLGKDSIVCLEWLTQYAQCDVVSLYFDFMANHPDDDRYWEYLRGRYPRVLFSKVPNPIELSNICSGVYQSPVEVLTYLNKLESNDFEMSLMVKELKKEFHCDYICIGQSKYENFARATKFHKKGILIGDEIFPIGMMTKEQVLGIIKASGMKLHPQYKTTPGTYDHPSYYKMRSGFIVSPEFKRRIYSLYPMLKLDEYRFERLLK